MSSTCGVFLLVAILYFLSLPVLPNIEWNKERPIQVDFYRSQMFISAFAHEFNHNQKYLAPTIFNSLSNKSNFKFAVWVWTISMESKHHQNSQHMVDIVSSSHSPASNKFFMRPMVRLAFHETCAFADSKRSHFRIP